MKYYLFTFIYLKPEFTGTSLAEKTFRENILWKYVNYYAENITFTPVSIHEIVAAIAQEEISKKTSFLLSKFIKIVAMGRCFAKVTQTQHSLQIFPRSQNVSLRL